MLFPSLSLPRLIFSRGELVAGFIAMAAAVLLAVLVETDKSASLEVALKHYREINNSKVDETVARVEHKFRQIHQGLRTIARLPGIRTIARLPGARAMDRDGATISDDARISVQEIYNNLAANVAVSEVYIVPRDFDPDTIDAQTGKLQEPIATFDDLIVGKTAESPDATQNGSQSLAALTADAEEIEIYEYRLMKKQIATFANRFSTGSTISYENYPAIMGEQVITCDNTRYSPSNPDDSNRMGLVYSVPFYGPNDRMRGIISAVILTASVQEMIPGGFAAIFNRAYQYVAGSSDSGLWQHKMNHFVNESGADSLLYSSVRALNILDAMGGWSLWSGVPDQEFWQSTAVVSESDKARLRHLLVFVLLSLSLFLIYSMAVRRRSAEFRNVELETRVQQRTVALAEAKAAAEQASLAKSQFLANVSHEIRTPLGIILGNADLLTNSDAPPPQVKRLDVIRSAGQNLLSLINQLLDISAVETGQITVSIGPVSLCQLIDETLDLFRDQAEFKNLTLEREIDTELPDLLETDELRLQEILINLLTNAIKFTDAGHIKLGIALLGQSRTGSHKVGFLVSDTGLGITKKDQENIFEPFQRGYDTITQRHGGMGLGLSISRDLVNHLGGELVVESRPKQGTTFSFTIEMNVPSSHETTQHKIDQEHLAPEPTLMHELDGLRVLVAEDNKQMRELVTIVLEAHGCHVRQATNGIEALTYYGRETYDVILMDCRMPEMDGYEATRTIRTEEKSSDGHTPIPIVALTANAYEENRAQCLQEGMTGFLTKPFTASGLVEIIAKAVHAQAPET